MKRSLLLSSVLLLGVFLVGCTNGGEETSVTEETSQNEQLSVAIVSWPGFTPLRIADEKGFYNDLGLDVEIKVIEDIGATKAAVQSGEVDLTWGTGDVLLTFADAGVDVQAFYAVDWSNGGDGVVVTDEIQEWSDFEGKEFVGQEGLPPANLFLYALQENGVDVSTVNFREMDTAAAALAFKAGQVDIAAVFQPYLSEVAEREDGRIFLSSADYPYVITDYISAKPETLAARKSAIEKFVAATDRAVQFIADNKEESVEITARNFGMPKEDIEGIFMDIEFPTLEDNKKLFTSPDIQKTFTTFQEAMLAAGVLQNPVDVSNMTTSEFVQ